MDIGGIALAARQSVDVDPAHLVAELLDVVRSEPQGLCDLAEALFPKARHDTRRNPASLRPRLTFPTARRRLVEQVMQGLVARSMVREIRAVVCGERAEDFAEPAAAVDDSSLSGGSEHERRSYRILVEQRVSGAACDREAEIKRHRWVSPAQRRREHESTRTGSGSDHPLALHP